MRLAVIALLFAASAALADTPPPSGPVSAPSGPPAQPLSVWRPLGHGDMEHVQSGLVCPGTTGGYRQSGLIMYDQLGLDVSCNYGAQPHDITVYMTRRDTGEIDPLFAAAQRDLLSVGAERHPRLIARSRPDIGGWTWITALYGEDGDIHSAIWMADLHGWTLEYRATYPAALETQVSADLAAITTWVQSSAGARLDRCAKSTPPTRDGVRVADKKTLDNNAMMTAVLGAAGQAMAQDGKGTPAGATTFCLEKTILDQPHRMQFWRGVADDGSAAPADQISGLTTGPPPILRIESDALASLVEKSSTAQWTATMNEGGQTSVYAYFQGRPSPQTVAALFSDILADKAKPLIGYSAHGKTINISMPGKH